MRIPGHYDVDFRSAGAEDVPGLLHGDTSEAGPVHVDDLVTNHESSIPSKNVYEDKLL